MWKTISQQIQSISTSVIDLFIVNLLLHMVASADPAVSNWFPPVRPQVAQTTVTTTSITKFRHTSSSYAYYPASVGTAEPLIKFTDPLYSSPMNYTRASDARSSTSPCRKLPQARRRSKRTIIYKQKNEICCTADQPLYYSLSSSELGSPEAVILVANDHHIRKSASVEFRPELLMFDEVGSWSSSSLRSSCNCCYRVSSSTAYIIIDLNHQALEESSISRKFQKLNEFDAASKLELRPILTKLPPHEPVHDMIDIRELSSAIRKSAGKQKTHLKTKIEP